MIESNLKYLVDRIEKLEREVEELKKIIGKEKKVPEIVESILKLQSKEYEEGYIVYIGKLEKFSWDITATSKILEEIYPEQVSMLADALSNPSRVKILLELLESEKTIKELSKNLKLEGGQLYHHLRYLTKNKLIQQKRRGEYKITIMGVQILLLLSLMSLNIVSSDL